MDQRAHLMKKKKKTLTQPSPASGRGLWAARCSFSRLREKGGMRVFYFFPYPAACRATISASASPGIGGEQRKPW
jgi:hypothetical protein